MRLLVIRGRIDLTLARVDPPEDEVRIIFDADGRADDVQPHVYARSAASPHRYLDGRLCLWFPGDPPDLRWEVEDGLAELFRITAAHLVREAIWRRTGVWPGPEEPHGYPEDRVA